MQMRLHISNYATILLMVSPTNKDYKYEIIIINTSLLLLPLIYYQEDLYNRLSYFFLSYFYYFINNIYLFNYEFILYINYDNIIQSLNDVMIK
jgi:hypothetical protein